MSWGRVGLGGRGLGLALKRKGHKFVEDDFVSGLLVGHSSQTLGHFHILRVIRRRSFPLPSHCLPTRPPHQSPRNKGGHREGAANDNSLVVIIHWMDNAHFS